MADRNRNQGSKQADGNDDSIAFKSKPTGKEAMGGSGGRTGSGIGSSGKSGGSNAGDSAGEGGKGQSAGRKNQNVESDIDEGDGNEQSGDSGSGSSGSRNR